MEIVPHKIPVQEQPGLAAELAGLRSVDQILGWMQDRGLPLDRLELVTQDEFSHDVLVPLAADGAWAAFGVT